MRGIVGRFGMWCAIAAIALLVLDVGAASSKPKPVKREHALLTFSGTAKGTYSWSVLEDDVGGDPGTCTAPSNSYTADDNYNFKWSEKFTLPEGVGSYVKPQSYKVTGTDITTQAQGKCTNGFGNPLGGDSYSCTQDWNPFEQSSTDYPTMSVGGPPTRLTATTSSGVQESGTPAGTNCVGASIGGAPEGFELSLKGALKFSAAELKRKGSLSKAVSGTKSAGCSSTTCAYVTCSTDSTPADVPTTCSTQQSYSGELKIQLLK